MVVSTIILLCTLFSGTLAYGRFRTEFPNGEYIIDPCGGPNYWKMVGHAGPDMVNGRVPTQDGEKFNPFGKAFRVSRAFTEELCTQDSDGDGVPNWKELGMKSENMCQYVRHYFNKPVYREQLIRGQYLKNQSEGHPGICEYNRPCIDSRFSAAMICAQRG